MNGTDSHPLTTVDGEEVKNAEVHNVTDPRKNAEWKRKDLLPLRYYLKMFPLNPPKFNFSRMSSKLTHATKSKGKGESKAHRKQAAKSRAINR